jgi:hypothetical protein
MNSSNRFALRQSCSGLSIGSVQVEFASRFILESIGVVVETAEEIWLDAMPEKFEGVFPATRDFSAYARSTLKDMNPQDGPDDVLMA